MKIRKEDLNYEIDVRIDPNALDIEWLKQAELMQKYTVHAANMKKKLDEIKEQLDVCKAKTEMDIRKVPEMYGLAKVTEGAIQSTIILQKVYQEMVQTYIKAKYEYDVAIAVVRAFDQKKTTLENLVRLLSTSYFAGPQTPRNLSQEWLQESKRKQENAKVKIQRRRAPSPLTEEEKP